MSTANLALRFLLELALLAALSIWGAHARCHRIPVGKPGHCGTTRGTTRGSHPLGAFVSPKARVLVRWRARLGVELALFGAATASLAVPGFSKLAVALAVAVAFHQGWRVADMGRPAR